MTKRQLYTDLKLEIYCTELLNKSKIVFSTQSKNRNTVILVVVVVTVVVVCVVAVVTVVTTVVGLFGGLSVVLRIVIPPVIKFIRWFRRKQNGNMNDKRKYIFFLY